MITLLVKLKRAVYVVENCTERDNTIIGIRAHHRRITLGKDVEKYRRRIASLEKRVISGFLPDGIVNLIVELSLPFFDDVHDNRLQSSILHEIHPVFSTVRVKTQGRSFELKFQDVQRCKLSRLTDHRKSLKMGVDTGDYLLNLRDTVRYEFNKAKFTWLDEGLRELGVPKINIDIINRVSGYSITAPRTARNLIKNCASMIDNRHFNNTLSADPRIDTVSGTGLVWYDKRDILTEEEGSRALGVEPIVSMLCNHKIKRYTKTICTNMYQPGIVRCIEPEYDIDFSLYKDERGSYHYGPACDRLPGKNRSLRHVTFDYMIEWQSKGSNFLDGNIPGNNETSGVVHENSFTEQRLRCVKELWNWECLKGDSNGSVGPRFLFLTFSQFWV
jgi:hypothetical protein